MAIYALRQKDFLKGDRIGVRRVLHQGSVSVHRHEFFEIAIVLSGIGMHVTDGQRRKIAAGDVIVINQKRAHSYEDTKRLNLINLLVRETTLRRIGRELRSLPGYHSLFNAKICSWQIDDHANQIKLSVAEREQIEEWVNRLEEECESRAAGSSFIAEAYLALIVADLSRKQSESEHPAVRARPHFGKLLSWLENNLGQKLAVRDLARQSGMSERSFYRGFTQAMGVTPGNYLIQMRIHRAAEMLQELPRTRRISEIAEACGFEDSNYFSRCFRRVQNCSPRDFRG